MTRSVRVHVVYIYIGYRRLDLCIDRRIEDCINLLHHHTSAPFTSTFIYTLNYLSRRPFNMPAANPKFLQYVEEHQQDYIDRLREAVEIPS
jgi:hypothetical protein